MAVGAAEGEKHVGIWISVILAELQEAVFKRGQADKRFTSLPLMLSAGVTSTLC